MEFFEWGALRIPDSVLTMLASSDAKRASPLFGALNRELFLGRFRCLSKVAHPWALCIHLAKRARGRDLHRRFLAVPYIGRCLRFQASAQESNARVTVRLTALTQLRLARHFARASRMRNPGFGLLSL